MARNRNPSRSPSPIPIPGGNRIQKTPADQTKAENKMAHKGATNKINCILGSHAQVETPGPLPHKNMHMMADDSAAVQNAGDGIPFPARIARHSTAPSLKPQVIRADPPKAWNLVGVAVSPDRNQPAIDSGERVIRAS